MMEEDGGDIGRQWRSTMVAVVVTDMEVASLDNLSFAAKTTKK
jgi:hypothetical protein